MLIIIIIIMVIIVHFELKNNYKIVIILRFETTKCIVIPSSTLYEIKVSGSFKIFPINYFY